jgi:hypothetical protein
MAVVTRAGSSTAPIVVGTHTVTMRSRTTALCVGAGSTTMFLVHARPDQVGVLDADGRHVTHRVHDWDFRARVAVASAVAAYAVLTRNRRRR